ncbi:hypothetical protein [Pseudomonas sp. PLMAX]|uniref:hypothetical protein n=1 Tax=Pseudomonas sp. PLMAX TaxID=2201998 RepID=UPI0038BDB3A6
MEVFLDNCVATELFPTEWNANSYDVSEEYYRYACDGIIKGLTSYGNSLSCDATLFYEYNKGSGKEPVWIHRDMKYTAKCDPSKMLKTKSDFESVHFDNFSLFDTLLKQIEAYLGVDFENQTHEEIADIIGRRFKMPKSHTYEIFNAQGLAGRAKITARPVKFNGKLVINNNFRVFDLVEGYSQSVRVQAFMTYILASVYLRFKGDSVFPLKPTGKKRDRRTSLINDFLYIYFIMDRQCIFVTSDRALVFKASATLRMLRKKDVIMLELDARRYITIQAKKLKKYAANHAVEQTATT